MTATSPENTLFIFDWDDTLLPSSWLKQNGFNISGSNITGTTKEMFYECEQVALHISALIEYTKQFGQVIIVTNATKSWVEFSCTTFMPSIAKMVLALPIISAADLYGGYKDPHIWKKFAFQREVLELAFPLPTPEQRTIISIGDSDSERFAVQSLTTIRMPYPILAKSVKFMMFSTPDVLKEQLAATLKEIPMIATIPESLDHQWEYVIPEKDNMLSIVKIEKPIHKTPRILSMFTPYNIEESFPCHTICANKVDK